MIVKVDTIRYFGPRSRARFYEPSVTPEALRYILYSVGARPRRDHGIFARLKIEGEERTVLLNADARQFLGRDPAWYGWLFDLAYEAGWEPLT